MVEVEGAERAFTKFYAKLAKVLPINDLAADFYANGLLPGDHKAKVESLSTRKEKAQYFLDEVIRPGLSAGYSVQFNKMINIMKSSDDRVVKRLAKQIEECALAVSPSSSSDDNGNYFVCVCNNNRLKGIHSYSLKSCIANLS